MGSGNSLPPPPPSPPPPPIIILGCPGGNPLGPVAECMDELRNRKALIKSLNIYAVHGNSLPVEDPLPIPLLPPLPQPRPFQRLCLPLPVAPPLPPPLRRIEVMIFMLYVKKMIQDIINKRRKNKNGEVPPLLTKYSYCLKSNSFSSSIPPEIPPECMGMLQNPEALIKSLNIYVPPDCMPEVIAALADLLRRAGRN